MVTRFRFLAFVLFLLSLHSVAAQVYGRIYGNEKEALAFATIYCKGTTLGSVSNAEGDYRLQLPAGNWTLVVRYLGYQLKEVPVEVGAEPLHLDITLESGQVQLNEVHVHADTEDPAYRIIRETIKKRSYFLGQVQAYTCDVYTKGVQRLLHMPGRIMGFSTSTISINGLPGNDSSLRGIIYLSESVSRLAFRQPDQVHEEMISSRVSGQNNAFSYNKASDLLVNFYENRTSLGPVSDRNFISPVANNALFYYRYRLLGSFEENGYLVHKIEVIPRRRHDPCFRGTVEIIDKEWRLHNVDLLATLPSPINYVDTLRIGQVFAPVEPDVWMPVTNSFHFSFDVLGVRGNGYFIGVNSNYNLHPLPGGQEFGGEEWKVQDSSNRRDSAYWEQVRPLPLTDEEVHDYQRKDSLEVLHKSKAWLDSMDRRSNRFRPGSFLLRGYTWRNSYTQESWHVSGILPAFQFNTAEGFLLNVNLSRDKELEHKRRLFITSTLRYGFGNGHFNPKLLVFRTLNNVKSQAVFVNLGSDVAQYNYRNPISPFLNTLYSLMDEKNYMKVYEKQFVRAGYRHELVNGIFLRTEAEWAHRYALQNTSSYRLVDDVYGTYTSNDPLNPTGNTPAFKPNEALVCNASLVFRFRQKYYSRPDVRIVTGSKYPSFTATWRKGIYGVAGSDVNFDQVTGTLKDDMDAGLLGTFSWQVKAGTFLNSRHLYFMDYAHVLTNRTFWMSSLRDPGDLTGDDGQNISGFNLLDYYLLSTRHDFVEAHAEQHFNGFLINKFPLLRKTRFQEVVGVHYLLWEGHVNYAEFAFGIEHIGLGDLMPGFLRIDYVTSVADSKVPVRQGIRFGIGF